MPFRLIKLFLAVEPKSFDHCQRFWSHVQANPSAAHDTVLCRNSTDIATPWILIASLARDRLPDRLVLRRRSRRPSSHRTFPAQYSCTCTEQPRFSESRDHWVLPPNRVACFVEALEQSPDLACLPKIFRWHDVNRRPHIAVEEYHRDVEQHDNHRHVHPRSSLSLGPVARCPTEDESPNFSGGVAANVSDLTSPVLISVAQSLDRTAGLAGPLRVWTHLDQIYLFGVIDISDSSTSTFTSNSSSSRSVLARPLRTSSELSFSSIRASYVVISLFDWESW